MYPILFLFLFLPFLFILSSPLFPSSTTPPNLQTPPQSIEIETRARVPVRDIPTSRQEAFGEVEVV